jgi:hypothetical protein
MTEKLASRPLPTSTSVPDAADRRGAVTVWAAVGVLWMVFVGQAWGRWLFSDREFRPAPILGPDQFSGTLLVVLRAIEVVSIGIAAATIWVFLIGPVLRERRLRLDGMIVIGGLIAVAIDPLINYFHYTFAWNAHAFNMGSWLAYFPHESGPTHYGEGLAWALPQYLYLGIGFAAIECRIILALRRRFPTISNVRAFGAASLCIFGVDVVIEQLFVRTQVYGYPRTWSELTLFAGTQYQFPIYESIFVAVYAAGFTALRMSAHDDPDGISFVERGAHRLSPRIQLPVRLSAVIGFCGVWAALAYFVPWSWMSVNADSLVRLPSFLQAGG